MDLLNNQKNTQDWHRADIVAALHKRGWSINRLAKAHKLSPSTIKGALDKPYPKSERIIAKAIGIKPEEIWPVRYANRNFKPVLQRQV